MPDTVLLVDIQGPVVLLVDILPPIHVTMSVRQRASVQYLLNSGADFEQQTFCLCKSPWCLVTPRAPSSAERSPWPPVTAVTLWGASPPPLPLCPVHRLVFAWHSLDGLQNVPS